MHHDSVRRALLSKSSHDNIVRTEINVFLPVGLLGREGVGVDPPTETAASLEDFDAAIDVGRGPERLGAGETGDASADHEHLDGGT